MENHLQQSSTDPETALLAHIVPPYGSMGWYQRSVNLDAIYTYDNEGRMLTQQYPSSWYGTWETAGPKLENVYDTMARLQKLRNFGGDDIIANAAYNAAGQLTNLTGVNGAPSEARTYNSLGQMTQLSAGSMAIAYHYSPTQNNGKIVSEQDLVSGETVAYTYDSLNRLASATSSVNPGWGRASAMMDSGT